MDVAALLTDGFGRVYDTVHRTVDGCAPADLAYRPDAEANSIAWLVWHLTRVQDDHVAQLAGSEQAWTTLGWSRRFGLPFDDADTGYGHGTDDVAAVTTAADLLIGYFDAVHAATLAYLARLTEDALDDVVDTSWDPPVTRGVRLVSVLDDDIQHAGQAAYVRGLAERRRR
jgi:uncharacterized damage-inducible protein DinB